MPASLNPGGIKVGDRVQRDKEWRGNSWPFGAKEVRVTAVSGKHPHQWINVEGSDDYEWVGEWFTVIRETRAIPDERYDPWKVRSPQYAPAMKIEEQAARLHPPIDYSKDAESQYAAKAMKPLEAQVGGDHYKSMKIQPVEYIHANKLGWCEANIVKYITRWRQKGQGTDIDKVIHYAQLLKQLEGIS